MRSGQKSLQVSSEPAQSWFDWFPWKLFAKYSRKLQKRHKGLGCSALSSQIRALALRASASTCAGKVALNIATCQSEDWNDWNDWKRRGWKFWKQGWQHMATLIEFSASVLLIVLRGIQQAPQAWLSMACLSGLVLWRNIPICGSKPMSNILSASDLPGAVRRMVRIKELNRDERKQMKK